MDLHEAYEILHPDTTRQKLAEIEYYGGFAGQQKAIEAVNEACVVACEAILELQLYKQFGDLKEIQCKHGAFEQVRYERDVALEQLKEIGCEFGQKMDEVRSAVEKQEAKKPTYVEGTGIRYTDLYRCPNCGQCFSGTGIADYCYHCGQAIDWGD